MSKHKARQAMADAVASLLRRLPQSVRVKVFAALAQELSSQAGGLDSMLPESVRPAVAPPGQNDPLPCAPVAMARLSRGEQTALFEALAKMLDVSAAEVAGRNGSLIGYFEDTGIFLPYLRERAWFWNAIEYIDAVFAARGNGTFIDVGANIGAVVVPVARAHPSVTCFAFEPAPNNFRALAHNIERNGVAANVKAFELALSNADGLVSFELSSENFGDHRMRRPEAGQDLFNENNRSTIEVAARRLDSIMSRHAVNDPLVVKIDVQGAELLILAGGQATLRQAELVFAEYWPYGMRRLGGEPRAFLDQFGEIFGFVARVGEHAIGPSDFVPFGEMRPELEAFAQSCGTMHLNLVLARNQPHLTA